MAEDDHPPLPSLDDYRALLAAARLWEATTRGLFSADDSTATRAHYLLRYYLRPGGPFPEVTDGLGLLELEARWAVRRIDLAILVPIDSAFPGDKLTDWAMRKAIAAMTPGGRARVVEAIDALAAIIDLRVASGELSAEAEEQMRKAKPGRPPENLERDASAWLMRHPPDGSPGEKWTVIASRLGYSGGDHARTQAGRWAKRNEQK